MNSTADFRRTAVALLGTVVLSATCVLGAVGPARAEAPRMGEAKAAQVIVPARAPILM